VLNTVDADRAASRACLAVTTAARSTSWPNNYGASGASDGVVMIEQVDVARAGRP